MMDETPLKLRTIEDLERIRIGRITKAISSGALDTALYVTFNLGKETEVRPGVREYILSYEDYTYKAYRSRGKWVISDFQERICLNVFEGIRQICHVRKIDGKFMADDDSDKNSYFVTHTTWETSIWILYNRAKDQEQERRAEAEMPRRTWLLEKLEP
jgi:hypothetical protein